MPSVSGKQHRLMAMASTTAGRAKLEAEGKKPPSKDIALEFRHADAGRRFTRKGKA